MRARAVLQSCSLAALALVCVPIAWSLLLTMSLVHVGGLRLCCHDNYRFLLFDVAGMEFGHWRIAGDSMLQRITHKHVAVLEGAGSGLGGAGAGVGAGSPSGRPILPVATPSDSEGHSPLLPIVAASVEEGAGDLLGAARRAEGVGSSLSPSSPTASPTVGKLLSHLQTVTHAQLMAFVAEAYVVEMDPATGHAIPISAPVPRHAFVLLPTSAACGSCLVFEGASGGTRGAVPLFVVGISQRS